MTSLTQSPGNRRTVESQCDPFFIVGTQRSGTTLLRLILNSHSKIAVPEEGVFLMPLLRKRYIKEPLRRSQLKAVAEYLRSNDHFRLWNYDHNNFIAELLENDQMSVPDLIDKLFTSYCRSQGKITWGDKTPSFFRKIDILHAMFPRAKYIHIVRDGRDVFDSWRKLDTTKDNVAVAALDWSYKLFKIERALGALADHDKLSIRYEDLLESPETIIRSVTDFLGVGYEKGMLDFYRTSHKYIGDHHSKLIFRPLDKCNKAKWKENLNPKEVRVFELLGCHYLTKYKYGMSAGCATTEDVLLAIKALIVGLPLRLMQVVRIALIVEKALRHGKVVRPLKVGHMPSEGSGLAGSGRPSPQASLDSHGDGHANEHVT